jgi:pyruvate kinase
MLADSFKRTKIVATIGPSSHSPKVMEELMLAGTNSFRLNLSHGTLEQHAEVIDSARKLSAKLSRPIAIIADLQGPKIRVGSLPTDGLPFVRGHVMRFEYNADFEKDGVVPVQHDVSKYLKTGERIFLRDGQIEVEVEKIEKKLITAKVLAPGLLFSNQGMNLPDTDLGGDILTDKDVSDIEFAASHDCDYIALSFVQTAADIKNLKTRLRALKSDLKIIAKIETKAAVDNLEAIVDAADVLMVARGDLAIETMPEAVPAVQRRMIELARAYKKPVIVATQMLESMISSPSPTRAEVSDVATAVLEGSDAVMLSGETAMGLFPVETVKMMKRVILYTEREEVIKLSELKLDDYGAKIRENAISAAAVVLARQMLAKVIVAETSSGQTARNIASLRPPVPIAIVTDKKRVYHQMAIVWGGKAYYHQQPRDAAEYVMDELRSTGSVKIGDALVVASGHQPGVTGGTDTVEIKIVT